MNNANIQKLKNITAESLFGLDIDCEPPFAPIKITTQIHTEVGSFARLSEISKGAGDGSVFLLSGEGLEEFDRQIIKNLSGEDISVKRVGKSVILNFDFARLVQQAVPCNAKIIIATGGGAICDLSKMLSKNLGIPLCFVPSAPTSDAMLSRFSVVNVGGTSQFLETKAPDFIVCDASECENVPAKLVRAGFGDAVSNYLAVFDWMVAKDFFDRPFCKEIAYLAVASADKAVFAGEVYLKNKVHGIELMFDALLLSSGAMALMNESTPCCGGEHAVAIAISKLADDNFMHGESVFLAFCKLVEVYKLFFWGYSKGKYLPPDTAMRCEFLIEHFGVLEERAESLCKMPISESEYKIIKEKYRICKSRYAPNITQLSKKIPHIKNIFFEIFDEDFEKFNLQSDIISKSIGIAPDIEDKFTTLTLMREFGLIDTLLV
ncbi:MAG: iron-containing alcohol dehydrogenase [Bacillota bacterium]